MVTLDDLLEGVLMRELVEQLREVAREYGQLQAEAEDRLHRRDARGYLDNLQASVRLIENLPARVGDLIPDGADAVRDRIDALAMKAARAMQDGEFAMSVFLIRLGSKTSDPNDLERLIEDLVRAR